MSKFPYAAKLNLDPLDSWLWTISWYHQCLFVWYLCGIFCVGFLIVGKTKLVRTLRSMTGPMTGLYLCYRGVSLCLGRGVETNVLSIIATLTTHVLETMQKYHMTITAFVGDIVGIIVIFAVMKAITELGNLKYTVLKKQLLASAYDSVKWIPIIQKEIKKEQTKLEEHFEDHLKKKSRAIGLRYQTLPPKGIDKRGILGLMRDVTGQEDQIWQAGKVSGAIYHGGSDHIDFLNTAFGCYSIANPLHPDIWPSGMKFEAEIISMASALVDGKYNNNNNNNNNNNSSLSSKLSSETESSLTSICGCTTSGGTESIVLAIKAHRDYYTHRHGITRPEMIACVTAHAAVDKACDMLGITLIKVPMCPLTCRISLPAVHSAVGANTIMLYGSAPSFPQVTPLDLGNSYTPPSTQTHTHTPHTPHEHTHTLVTPFDLGKSYTPPPPPINITLDLLDSSFLKAPLTPLVLRNSYTPPPSLISPLPGPFPFPPGCHRPNC